MNARSEPPFLRWLHRRRRADGLRWRRMKNEEILADIRGRARRARSVPPPEARRVPPRERIARLPR